ncbi:hypothetical protein D6D17_08613 [Aureobasidium pullulans]|nr:hypothetical protein D6D17_08613 [Aureobasidium pullulans]
MTCIRYSRKSLPNGDQGFFGFFRLGGWGAHKSQGDLPWATYRAVVRRQSPVVGLAVQSLKRLCSGYDAIDNAFYITQARVSNMLRAQRRHVKIKMEVNASPRLSSLGSRFEIGLVYHGLYSAAVCPGVALGDLVIDLPSPPTTPDLVPHRTNLLLREFALRDSSVESSALVTQNRSRSIANYTMRNVKMHARLAFGHPMPCSWKNHIEEISMSSFVDSVLVGNLWTPRCFEDIDPNLPQQPKVKHFEAIDQWSVQFDLDRLVAETE